jgi:hypothetical protein
MHKGLGRMTVIALWQIININVIISAQKHCLQANITANAHWSYHTLLRSQLMQGRLRVTQDRKHLQEKHTDQESGNVSRLYILCTNTPDISQRHTATSATDSNYSCF